MRRPAAGSRALRAMRALPSPAGLYGASPLHLLLVLCSLALTLYAGLRLLKGDTLGVLLWFAGAALVHDLVLLPLYTVTDRALHAVLRRAARPPRTAGTAGGGGRAAVSRTRVNHVRVPALLSLLLLLVWFPLILRTAPERYADDTGLDPGVFLARWLLITAALFAVSALCLLAALVTGRRSGGDAGGSGSPVRTESGRTESGRTGRGRSTGGE